MIAATADYLPAQRRIPSLFVFLVESNLSLMSFIEQLLIYNRLMVIRYEEPFVFRLFSDPVSTDLRNSSDALNIVTKESLIIKNPDDRACIPASITT